jgi:hypothetical protein
VKKTASQLGFIHAKQDIHHYHVLATSAQWATAREAGIDAWVRKADPRARNISRLAEKDWKSGYAAGIADYLKNNKV